MNAEFKTAAATTGLASDRQIIRCCFVPPLMQPTTAVSLTVDRQLAFEAMRLLLQLDRLLREARADWNQDRFRGVMRLRNKASARVRRRWSELNPTPGVCLGRLRRRYHANLAGYLYSGEP